MQMDSHETNELLMDEHRWMPSLGYKLNVQKEETN